MEEGNSTGRDVSRRHRQESGPAAGLLNRDRDMSGAVREPVVLSTVIVWIHLFASDRLHAIEFVQQATAFVIADPNRVSIFIPLHDPVSIIVQTRLPSELLARAGRTAEVQLNRAQIDSNRRSCTWLSSRESQASMVFSTSRAAAVAAPKP